MLNTKFIQSVAKLPIESLQTLEKDLELNKVTYEEQEKQIITEMITFIRSLLSTKINTNE